MRENKKTGDYGEKLAAEYLAEKGYEILETNFRRRTGEIDIVAKDGAYHVFIEVKLRKGIGMGYPREAVGRVKQEKLRKAALLYLSENRIGLPDVRFDVIEIICGNDNKTEIEHIENAF